MWINAPALAKDQHLWVEFDGVAMRSETYLNGAKDDASDLAPRIGLEPVTHGLTIRRSTI